MLLKYFEITNAFNREMPESMVKNEQIFLKWNKTEKNWFTRVLIQFDILILIWTRKKTHLKNAQNKMRAAFNSLSLALSHLNIIELNALVYISHAVNEIKKLTPTNAHGGKHISHRSTAWIQIQCIRQRLFYNNNMRFGCWLQF